jgi:HEAT repeat protein
MSIPHFEDPGLWALVLATDDATKRKAARETLVGMGFEATPVLVELLHNSLSTVRWEAALALKEIGDPASSGELAEALKDENGDVRWVAAEALAATGTDGLEALLRVLMKDGDSFELRDAANVAISIFRTHAYRDLLSGLSHALKHENAPAVVMMEAAEAMDVLKKRGRDVA